nr:hypothetical protein [Uliginosibacterium gangwonense]
MAFTESGRKPSHTKMIVRVALEVDAAGVVESLGPLPDPEHATRATANIDVAKPLITKRFIGGFLVIYENQHHLTDRV